MMKQEIVDGKWTAREANIRGEFLHATANHAEIPVYVYVGWDGERWGTVMECTIEISLRPGYSARDHLFDRTICRVVEAIKGRCFKSIAKAKAASYGHSKGDGEYTVEVKEGAVIACPTECRDEYERIDTERSDREVAKKRRELLKTLKGMRAYPAKDGRWKLSDEEHEGNERLASYSYGYTKLMPGNLITFCSPHTTWETQEQAEATLAEWIAATK